MLQSVLSGPLDIAAVAFLILHDWYFVFGMYWVRISNVSRSLDYSVIFKFCHNTLSRLGRLLTLRLPD